MRWILILSTVVVLALAMGMGGAVATDGDDDNESANQTPDYEAQFDDDLRITDYEFHNGEARITFDADRSRTVVVSDALAGVDQDGAVQVPSEEYGLDSGETTISMDVREVRGSSVVGVSVGDATVRLGSEFVIDDEPHDPLKYFGGMSGLFTGIFMTTGLAATAAVYVVKREDSGVITA